MRLSSARLRRARRVATTRLSLAACLSLTLLSACGRGRAQEYAVLPDFAMSAVGPEKETPFTKADMLGRAWIVDFVFTRCSGPCPLLSKRMAELSEKLPPEVGLMTITVDPDGDTPERLRAYAKAYGARPGRWVFLRGGEKETYELMYAGFRLPISTDPKAPEGSRVIHSTRLVLVDGRGTIRGYYDGLGDSDAASLTRDARRLLEVGHS